MHILQASVYWSPDPGSSRSRAPPIGRIVHDGSACSSRLARGLVGDPLASFVSSRGTPRAVDSCQIAPDQQYDRLTFPPSPKEGSWLAVCVGVLGSCLLPRRSGEPRGPEAYTDRSGTTPRIRVLRLLLVSVHPHRPSSDVALRSRICWRCCDGVCLYAVSPYGARCTPWRGSLSCSPQASWPATAWGESSPFLVETLYGS